jgi:hypothetical protein
VLVFYLLLTCELPQVQEPRAEPSANRLEAGMNVLRMPIWSPRKGDDAIRWSLFTRFRPLVLLLPLLLTNCSSIHCCMAVPLHEGQDTVHYLVVGLGILTVPTPGTSPGVLAARLHTLGVSISDHPGLKVAIGYTSSMTVAVPDGAEDVRVEISQQPGGPLIIDAQKAVLAAGNR